MTGLSETEAGGRAPAVTGAILAGGQSRRMGQDKALVRVRGKSLAHWVAEVLEPVVTEVWLVSNSPETHLGLGLPLITDLVPFQGPVGGLATALFHARTPWVLLASVDAPFLSPALAAAMVEAAGKITRLALVCQADLGLEPFPGLYAVRLLPRVEDFLTVGQSFNALLARVRPEVWGPEVWRRFDPEGRSFRNLNRPEDLGRLGSASQQV